MVDFPASHVNVADYRRVSRSNMVIHLMLLYMYIYIYTAGVNTMGKSLTMIDSSIIPFVGLFENGRYPQVAGLDHQIWET